VLTLLDDSYPLIYSITKDTSDGLKFVGFWCDIAADYLFAGDTTIGDNCSFHCKGWSGNTVRIFLRELGVNYRMLPKYSPELNPAERVFSFLKAQLRFHFTAQADLLVCITTSLDKITIPMMIGWYQGSGYLK